MGKGSSFFDIEESKHKKVLISSELDWALWVLVFSAALMCITTLFIAFLRDDSIIDDNQIAASNREFVEITRSQLFKNKGPDYVLTWVQLQSEYDLEGEYFSRTLLDQFPTLAEFTTDLNPNEIDPALLNEYREKEIERSGKKIRIFLKT